MNVCVILGERVPRGQIFKYQIQKKIKNPLFYLILILNIKTTKEIIKERYQKG